MLQHKFHCKRFFFSLSKHTTHVLLLHKFHCKRFFFSLSLNTPHTYTSSPQLPQLSSLNVISTLKYKIKLFFFSSNSTDCYSSIQSIVQQYKKKNFSLYFNSLRPQRSFSTLQFLHFSPLESLVLPPLKIASIGPVLSRKNHYSFVRSFSPPQ